jgi:branched-chain amino acid transport system permease protein
MEGFLVMVGVLMILGWALYLPFRAGQMYNGPIFCMAIGGYLAAYATRDLLIPIPLAFLMAVTACTVLSYLLSFTLATVTGFAMAVATIALIFIVQTIIRNMDFLGGSSGFSLYPPMPHILPVTYAFVFLVMFFLRRLSNSRFGRAIEALDVDPDLAAGVGINRKGLSMFLQTVSGGLGGLAGVLYAFNIGTLFPEIFSFNLLLYGFTMVMVGGCSTLWGVPLLAPILWGIPEFAPEAVGEWRNIMFASIIILLLILNPKGIITKNFIKRITGGNRLRKA